MNKTTNSIKESLEFVYQKIGGDAAFAEWATSEPTEFYKIFAKLIPRDINANVSGGLTLKVVNEFQ